MQTKHLNSSAAKTATEKFFSNVSNAASVEEDLWNMMVAAFSSKDLDDYTASQRSNMLFIYKNVIDLVKELEQEHKSSQEK